MLNSPDIFQLISSTAIVADGVKVVEGVDRIGRAWRVGGRPIGYRWGPRAGAGAGVDVAVRRWDVLHHVGGALHVLHLLTALHVITVVDEVIGVAVASAGELESFTALASSPANHDHKDDHDK